MKKENRKQLGDYGEQLALKAYIELGYTLLEKQFRCKIGEIDLIVQKENIITFVEVRTKTSTRYGTAEESITPEKKRRIYQVSQYYLLSQNDRQYQVQFDVVTVWIDKVNKKARLHRIPQAF